MHAVAKCCSLYCSCVMVSGIVFFAILAIMEANGNMFLTRGQTPEQTSDKITALTTTMVVNFIVLILCMGYYITGSRKEKEEMERQKQLNLQRARQGLDIF